MSRSHIKPWTATLLMSLATCTAYSQETPSVARTGNTATSTKSPDRSIALYTAVQIGDVKAVDDLLVHGADVNAGNQQGNTALHFAAKGEHVEVAKLLIDYKANINATNEDGRTPLHYASLSSHVAVLKLLLASHADVNAKDRRAKNPLYLGHGGRTPLHYAAAYRRTDVAELLLAAGADVNAQDDEGKTPLFDQNTDPRWTGWINFQYYMAKTQSGNGQRMGSLTFAESASTLPLQAADMLAYRMRQLHEKSFLGHEMPQYTDLDAKGSVIDY